MSFHIPQGALPTFILQAIIFAVFSLIAVLESVQATPLSILLEVIARLLTVSHIILIILLLHP